MENFDNPKNDNVQDDIDINITSCLIDSAESSDSNEYFDRVIGHIEDIIMEDEFQILHRNFLENNWKTFENTQENKIEYMDIFQNYTNIFEKYIVDELNKRMGDFDMNIFAKCLENERSHVDSEIFDIIQSLLDFIVFKEMMLDYRSEKEGKFDSLKNGIIIKNLSDDNY